MPNKLLLIIPLLLIISIVSYQEASANKPTIVTQSPPPMKERMINNIPTHIVKSNTWNYANGTHTAIIHSSVTVPITTIQPTTRQPTLHYPFIEVIRSQVCLTMIKANISSACPTMKALSLFDTSNQFISGKFVPGHNGDYMRTPPQVKNNWMFYDKPIVCVECETNFFKADVVKIINIEPDSFTFVNKTEIAKNGVYTTFSDRLFQGCNSATIKYEPRLLSDTINYFTSDCKTKIDQGNKTNTSQHHTFLSKDSVQIQYNNYINQVKNISLGDCIHYKCDIPSYGKKW